MSASKRHKESLQKLKNDLEESVVRETRRQDSVECNIDPNDMPLEIAKNLESHLGPCDTEQEQDKLEQEDNSPSFRP